MATFWEIAAPLIICCYRYVLVGFQGWMFVYDCASSWPLLFYFLFCPPAKNFNQEIREANLSKTETGFLAHKFCAIKLLNRWISIALILKQIIIPLDE